MTTEEELARLRSVNARLVAALEFALDHISELRDAWARGALAEHDGHGGMRSNRNVEAEGKIRAALAAGGR